MRKINLNQTAIDDGQIQIGIAIACLVAMVFLYYKNEIGAAGICFLLSQIVICLTYIWNKLEAIRFGLKGTAEMYRDIERGA